MDSTSLFVFLSECPRGWLHFENKCYYFSHDVLNWYEASYVCEAHNAHLVVVESPAENDFLELEAEARKVSFWLGATDDFVEGDWRWVLPERKFNFTDWAPKAPDNLANNEDCLFLYNAQKWKWNDAPCNWRVPHFICEKDYPGASSEIIG